MAFNPENRFPRKGIPVYNSSSDQMNLSDPIYSYKDGLENTSKIADSSTDNYYGTTGAALARSVQIGCNGYHTALAGNDVYYYVPCESPERLAERLDQLDSAINFSYIGNYRVLSWDQPFSFVSEFNGWIIDLSGAVINNSVLLDNTADSDITNDIAIEFRYSIDGESWSLWANVGTALTGISKNYTSNLSSEEFKIELDPANPFYPEFRFTSVVVNPDGSIAWEDNQPIDPTVSIVDFDLALTYNPDPNGPQNDIITRPTITCSNEKSNRPVVFSDNNFTFDPYAINKGLNLYKDLSLIVNKIFGFDTNYYSVQPQARGKDVVLKEYTIFDVVDEKCVKVVIPLNQFPDSKINIDPFGVQFEEPFEAHIDKIYFESIFGRGSQPRKRDIIYFPLTNRIYEINSTYLFRDFMYAPVYYKTELKKYNPKASTYFRDPALKEELEGISLTHEKLFRSDIISEEEKITKPQQFVNSSQRREDDPVRSYLYEYLSIIGYDLNNNWTIIFNNYYDLADAFLSNSDFVYEPNKYRNAIRYKSLPSLAEEGEISYTAWFSLKNYNNENSLSKKPYSPAVISIDSETDSAIVYTTYPYKHGLSTFLGHQYNPEGYVSIKSDSNHTGGFRVNSVIDEYKFSVENPNLPYAVDTGITKMQKSQARNLLDGTYIDGVDQKGIRIDLIHSGTNETKNNNFIETGSIEISLNELSYNSQLQFIPEQGEWYGLVVNISNKYKQMGINIWKMSYDPNNPTQQSTNLVKVHEDYRALTSQYTFSAPSDIETDFNNPLYGTDNNSYKIFTSPVLLGNVRIFKNMIDIEKQPILLNQNIVRDEHLAYIIDNAKPKLILPKFARNR